jgi:YHS domain-containing protein
MKFMRFSLTVIVVMLTGPAVGVGEPSPKSPKEALRAFNVLIGTWRTTGTPEGTLAEKQRGFWTESMSWEWQFKGRDAWLEVVQDKGKYFARGELRYVPAKDVYQLAIQTPTKETLTFTGPLKERTLTLERVDEAKKETQRLVVDLLHENRLVYRYEVKPEGRPLFKKVYQVGATKEGEPFAGPADTQPECVVSGGRGTIAVSYKGQTYYVCCSGCRSAFKEEPEKYIQEYEARKKEKRR